VSFVEKSEPETLMVAPNDPALESKEIDGFWVEVVVLVVDLVEEVEVTV
jgi:hypothetical protein